MAGPVPAGVQATRDRGEGKATAEMLASIDLRFDQHCDNGAPALHGQIHWIR